jgi:hypothetical protein
VLQKWTLSREDLLQAIDRRVAQAIGEAQDIKQEVGRV